MTKPVTNFPASARARLLEQTKKRKGDFQLTLQRYVAERFLYRMGASAFRDRFVLKGAMLFFLWDPMIIRPTRDLDLAGYWENDAPSLKAAFLEICSFPYPRDGLEFDFESISIEPIRDGAEYHGFRIRVNAILAAAVIPFQVDVGFGDAIVPAPVEIIYPVLLDMDAPRIRAYPREAAIAEKLHAMVSLAGANSRYKDFYDVLILSERFAFEGALLAASVSATFSRRRSLGFAPWPVALTPAFYSETARADQWLRYLNRSKLMDAPQEFAEAGERVIAFLQPPARAVASGEAFESHWNPGGPWR